MTVLKGRKSPNHLTSLTHRLSILLLVGVPLVGCGPNHRYYYKGNIKLTAVFQDGGVAYRNLIIGNPASPFHSELDKYGDLLLELPTGEVIPFQDLTVKKLRELASETRMVADLGYDSGWPKDCEQIQVGNRLVFYAKDNLVFGFHANAVGLRDGESPPRFGRQGWTELIPMPFDEQQVLKLFGKPDKQDDIWHG